MYSKNDVEFIYPQTFLFQRFSTPENAHLGGSFSGVEKMNERYFELKLKFAIHFLNT